VKQKRELGIYALNKKKESDYLFAICILYLRLCSCLCGCVREKGRSDVWGVFERERERAVSKGQLRTGRYRRNQIDP
jgi:hypothetical protein